MRRIAIINQKGGVGKTTTAANLGAALARMGRRALVVDMDPQANLTLCLGIDTVTNELPSTYSVLLGETPLVDTIVPTATKGLFVLPSHIDLSGAELELASAIGRETILRDAIDEWEAAYRAENDGEPPVHYVIFDCAPSLGLLSVNALAAAREVLITLQTEFFALQGMSKLVEVVQLLRRRLNPDLSITGILPCLYDNRLRLAREVLAEIRRYFPGEVFKNAIRTNVKLAESPSYGQTIFEYAPDSNGAKDHLSFALEVVEQESRDPELAQLPRPDIEALQKSLLAPRVTPVPPSPRARAEQPEDAQAGAQSEASDQAQESGVSLSPDEAPAEGPHQAPSAVELAAPGREVSELADESQRDSAPEPELNVAVAGPFVEPASASPAPDDMPAELNGQTLAAQPAGDEALTAERDARRDAFEPARSPDDAAEALTDEASAQEAATADASTNDQTGARDADEELAAEEDSAQEPMTAEANGDGTPDDQTGAPDADEALTAEEESAQERTYELPQPTSAPVEEAPADAELTPQEPPPVRRLELPQTGPHGELRGSEPSILGPRGHVPRASANPVVRARDLPQLPREAFESGPSQTRP